MSEPEAQNVFTAEEERELVRLLRKVEASGSYWPSEESFRAAHSVMPHWAPELVITRIGDEGVLEILLARYDGGIEEFRDLWHIPGGYGNVRDRVGVSADEVGWDVGTLKNTVLRVGNREVKVPLLVLNHLGMFWWRRREGIELQSEEHPYGYPLSIYLDCLPEEDVVEDENLRYFRVDQLPEDMVEPHRRFVQGHFVT